MPLLFFIGVYVMSEAMLDAFLTGVMDAYWQAELERCNAA